MTRPAKSLEVLRHQIDDRWKDRDKRSDGGIGDERHKKSKSDHNADKSGVFHARDFTHDPVNGPAGRALANALAASRDPRIKNMISDDQIMAGKDGPAPWVWRDYQRDNPKRNRHTHHMHLSVRSENGDDMTPWDLSHYHAAPVRPGTIRVHPETLRHGYTGAAVEQLQSALNRHGAKLVVDGVFGDYTLVAVEDFQRSHDLHVDGVVGPYTWEKLDAN